jgi:RHS repeat-associated protein
VKNLSTNSSLLADGGNITQYVYVDGIDHAVLLRRNGQLYALITDHLGSVVAILNSAGNLVEGYDYTPFGRTTATGIDVGNVLGFTGREYDSASGLYYYRARWYSPDLGRFLEPDPIGLAGWDVNLYRYVGNGPVDSIDPTGEFWGLVVGGGAVLTLGRFGIAWYYDARSAVAAADAYNHAAQSLDARYGSRACWPDWAVRNMEQWWREMYAHFGASVAALIASTPDTVFTGPAEGPRTSRPGAFAPAPGRPPRDPRLPPTPLHYPTRDPY